MCDNYTLTDSENKGRQGLKNIGTFNGYYITNGKAVEVTWIKAGESDPTIYLDKKTGEQIEMNTGKTYVSLVPSDSWSDMAIQ